MKIRATFGILEKWKAESIKRQSRIEIDGKIHVLSDDQLTRLRKKIACVISIAKDEIEPKVQLGGDGWRNPVQTDERTKGGRIHGIHGKVTASQGSYWGAVGKDPQAGFKKRVIVP